jgi:hypothetical protein
MLLAIRRIENAFALHDDTVVQEDEVGRVGRLSLRNGVSDLGLLVVELHATGGQIVSDALLET